VRDVLLASISSGQLPLALVGLVIIIGFIVMGGQNVYNLFVQSIDTFKNIGFLGWIFFIISIFISALAIRTIKKAHSKEIKHLEDEYNLMKDKNSKAAIESDLVKLKNQKKSSKK
jgi:hypothetical protein